VAVNQLRSLSRRTFLARTAASLSAAALCPANAAAVWPPPVVVFSKVFQELKLDREQAAELTEAAGLDGVDCPVRPGGEIEPDRAAEELPRYAEALRRRGRRIGLLTTHITSPASPHAETILRTARALGVRWYRTGYWRISKDKAPNLDAIRSELRDLAAMNRELGITGVVQNHSGAFVGGDLDQMERMLDGCHPDHIGLAFDFCHALITHGEDWVRHYERLAPRIRVVYVKDVRLPRDFVPLGEGALSRTGWVARVRGLNLESPISLHIEYDWAHGEPKTPDRLAAALHRDLAVLNRWLSNPA